MGAEKRKVRLHSDNDKYFMGELVMYEEAPNDEDMVELEIIIDEKSISCKSENFFSALQEIRKELEGKGIQILCNGASENVYPSAIQLSMGYGDKAYKLNLGQQARSIDIVDIFNCDTDLKFVSRDEQMNYYERWIRSL